ncbi:uncharacterized protein LOC120680878 [Panicum virgatum]|uniref:uncharacterized protein LOC120680878 n=1 Tax=Panicum virgatum TaxID=38727 RepID=UPI0019D618C1|nr:uncharacterized protein LOC120680878 [Panicum virgatum]
MAPGVHAADEGHHQLGANVTPLPSHERARASIFLRHHIHPDLKMEYLEVKDPLTLWTKLRERFGPQSEVLLPQAQNEWANLRLLDFKSVAGYNTAIHRIASQQRFCGQIVTEVEMIEKTLATFHPTNMVLQQQYRNNRYTKYSDLVNMLLSAKAHNELLMSNFQQLPVGSAAALLEVHANFSNEKKKKGQTRLWRDG